jgi:hypothetical protein
MHMKNESTLVTTREREESVVQETEHAYPERPVMEEGPETKGRYKNLQKLLVDLERLKLRLKIITFEDQERNEEY